MPLERIACALERIAAAMEAGGAVTSPETPLRLAGEGIHEPEARWLALMERWLAEAHAGGVTPATISKRRSVVTGYLRAVRGDLSREATVQWGIVRGARLAPSTMSFERRVVRSYCRWLVEEQHIERDPTRGLKAPKVPDDIGSREATPDEALALIRATTDHIADLWAKNRRDVAPRHVLYAAMYGAGLRAIQVKRLGWEDFTASGIRLRKKGKTIKTRIHPAPEWLLAMVAEAGRNPDWRAKPRPFKVKIQPDTFRADLERAGVAQVRDGDKLTIHGLRKAYTTALAAAGANTSIIAKLAGHADPKVTEAVYIRGTGLDLAGWAAKIPGPADFFGQSAPRLQVHEGAGDRDDPTPVGGLSGGGDTNFALDIPGAIADDDNDDRSIPVANTLQSSERAREGRRPGSSDRQSEPRTGSPPSRALSLHGGSDEVRSEPMAGGPDVDVGVRRPERTRGHCGGRQGGVAVGGPGVGAGVPEGMRGVCGGAAGGLGKIPGRSSHTPTVPETVGPQPAAGDIAGLMVGAGWDSTCGPLHGPERGASGGNAPVRVLAPRAGSVKPGTDSDGEAFAERVPPTGGKPDPYQGEPGCWDGSGSRPECAGSTPALSISSPFACPGGSSAPSGEQTPSPSATTAGGEVSHPLGSPLPSSGGELSGGLPAATSPVRGDRISPVRPPAHPEGGLSDAQARDAARLIVAVMRELGGGK